MLSEILTAVLLALSANPPAPTDSDRVSILIDGCWYSRALQPVDRRASSVWPSGFGAARSPRENPVNLRVSEQSDKENKAVCHQEGAKLLASSDSPLPSVEALGLIDQERVTLAKSEPVRLPPIEDESMTYPRECEDYLLFVFRMLGLVSFVILWSNP